MKFLIVYRGNCNRYTNLDLFFKNFLLKIKNPLNLNGHEFDCALFTYQNETSYCDAFIKLFNPKFVKLFSYSNQKDQFISILKFLNSKILDEYDKIIFLRFDICYKMNIMKWDFFDKKGIFFPFKEDSQEFFEKEKLHGDVIIICDTCYMLKLTQILEKYASESNIYGFPHFPYNMLHFIPKLLNNLIPVYNLIDGFFQSNTQLELEDKRINPLYIIMYKVYNFSDFYLLETKD